MVMIGVDVGGTFTDVVAFDGDEIRTYKVPTSYPDTERSVLAGAELAGVVGVKAFNHASTHGLNAVITRKLPKIAFLTTDGHRDILDQGRAWRPPEAMTDPHWRRPFGDAARPLVPRYLRRGITERILADGSVLVDLDEDQVRRQLGVLRRCGVEGVAICLLNSYVNPAHEVRLGRLVRQELGDVPFSLSSDVSPLAKEFSRASTTTIDVFMRLIYGGYTDRLRKGLSDLGFDGELNYANCAAQLLAADVAVRRPFEVVFAGPAAGTVSAAHFGDLVGARDLLCADVGGTSCDISLVRDSQPIVGTSFELEHDLVVNALSNDVASIGAGGGSLVTINAAGEVQVGPGSARAVPGPACYGRGGREPTTTDACLLMGIIDPEGFADGQIRLDADLARQAFERLPGGLSVEERISYAFRIGVNNIAEGVNNVVVRKGIDPRDFSLVAFGAAGPMLLPATLDLVHAAEVLIPPHPGLFSALGLVSSDQVYADSRTSYLLLTDEAAGALDRIYTDMEASLRERLGQAGGLQIVRTFDGRLKGQTWETPRIPVPAGPIDAAAVAGMVSGFHAEYEARWGNRFESLAVQGVTYRVEAVIPAEKVSYRRIPKGDGTPPQPSRTLTIRYLTDGPVDAAEYRLSDLRAGDTFVGAAVVREALSTTFVHPGQHVRVGEFGELHITRPATDDGGAPA